jgi:hypothetical protein
MFTLVTRSDEHLLVCDAVLSILYYKKSFVALDYRIGLGCRDAGSRAYASEIVEVWIDEKQVNSLLFTSLPLKVTTPDGFNDLVRHTGISSILFFEAEAAHGLDPTRNFEESQVLDLSLR